MSLVLEGALRRPVLGLDTSAGGCPSEDFKSIEIMGRRLL